MVTAQPSFQPMANQIDHDSDELPLKDEIAKIMNEYHARVEEMAAAKTASTDKPADGPATNDINANIKKSKGIPQRNQKTTNTINPEVNRQAIKEDSRIINNSRLKVKEANISIDELDKELKKMEAYTKVLTMVRRSLNAMGYSYWDPVYTEETKP